jgi:hypothetical protein
MTTIDRAIIVVWFTPAMIEGSAKGTCTDQSCCRGEAPKACVASTISAST